MVLGRNVAGTLNGKQIGRYVVRARIGEGGMGVVCRAYDPTMQREVAIKLLRSRSASAEDHARMIREAKALAQLSHPNVVAVFDVGHVDGDPFIAMEYCAGQTLQQWLITPRPWQEIVRVFVQAGRGLAAAHARGILHRDFKLSNVMFGDDGRVRVLDFGLARPIDSRADESSIGMDTSSSDWADNSEITQAGLVMGTVPTMAPEQHRGADVDARCDQFSYCAALFHALFGRAAFTGPDIAALYRAKRDGVLSPIDPDTPVPRAIQEAIRRGLSAAPEDRFADMPAVLSSLEVPARRSLRTHFAIATVVLGVGVAAVAPTGFASSSPCDTLDDGKPVWDDAMRQRVEAAFEATALPYAGSSWQRIDAALARRAGAWDVASREICSGADAPGERAVACLAQRRAELRALAMALQTADAGWVEMGMLAVRAIEDPQRCADEHAAGHPAAPPAEDAQVVAQLRARLAGAASQYAAGRYEAANAIVREVEPGVDQVGFAALTAEAALRAGLTAMALSDQRRAARQLERAYFSGSAIGYDRVAFEAASALVSLVGVEQGRTEDGETWLRHANALLPSVADTPRHRATLLARTGALRSRQGHADEALALHREALALRSDVLAPDDPLVAISHDAVGQALHDLKRFDEAADELQQGLDLKLAILGPDHPHVALAMVHLGHELETLGDVDGAVDKQRAAVRLQRRALPPDHAQTAKSLGALGLSLASAGRLAEARDAQREGVAMLQRVLGSSHPDVAWALGDLGRTLCESEELEAAETALRRALMILDDNPDSDPRRRAALSSELAKVRRGLSVQPR